MPDKTENTKRWGQRFATGPDARAEAFTSSIPFDHRMAREDVRGSIAHARMLGVTGIIPEENAATLIDGLWQLMAEIDADEFEFSLADEDIHTATERRLRELVGSVQGKLHTARSRNDQVATDFRLWTKGAILEIAGGLIQMIDALLATADAAGSMVMPGYTHTQRAQPVLVGHHLHAYVEMFLRDLERLRQAYQRLNRSPLGSAALAGSTFPIDREATATELGFDSPTANSMDGISDRDFVLDTMYAIALAQVHISRLAEELIWWSSGEFRFVEIADAFSTGSSIMPQKKNADVAELSRGKTGRSIGRLTGMLTTMKGLPLTYNSDMQEDKEALFESVDTVLAVLSVFPAMVRTLRFNEAKLQGAATADFSLATDAADLLARNGVPFREAHEVVGALVRQCIDRGTTFNDLSPADWKAAHPVFAMERPPATALESVQLRDHLGGTAPNQVANALAAAQTRVDLDRGWLEAEQQRRQQLFTRDEQR